LLELQSPYGLLAFQQPLGSETILFQELFGLDNGEHFSRTLFATWSISLTSGS